MKNLKIFLMLGTASFLFSFDIPKAWFKSGNKPDSYYMGIEKGAGRNGKNAAVIQSIDSIIEGFGTLMQTCLPDKFLGHRIRMSGYIKSKDAHWAALWLRVGQPNSDQPFSYDNMQDRSIKGSTDWTKYEIVVDVPFQSDNISFGASLSGTGTIWFDNIIFEIVDNSVLTTGNGNVHFLPQEEPSNLDFEE